MNLVLFGPPGAGKGTQSQFMIEKFNLAHVSTGDLLRQAVKDKTPLGLEAKKFMEAGDLVPDSIMIGLIQQVMKSQVGSGLLLDGFPRTAAQAKALDDLMRAEGTRINKAVFLEVDKGLLKARLTGRRVCAKCGATYHVEMRRSKVAGVCDVCGGALEHRKDDQPEVIENRLEVYEKNTAPLKSYYKDAGLFVSVDGMGDPAEIFSRISKAVGA